MKKLLSIFILAASFLSAPSAFSQDDIVTTLVKKGFNTTLKNVAETELAKTLSGAGPYTFLAPTDNAYRDIPKAQLDALLADKDKLKALLDNHIVEGKLTSAQLKSSPLKTLAGKTIEAKVVDGKIKIGTAVVVKPDLDASNGVIHGVDKLLLP